MLQKIKSIICQGSLRDGYKVINFWQSGTEYILIKFSFEHVAASKSPSRLNFSNETGKFGFTFSDPGSYFFEDGLS